MFNSNDLSYLLKQEQGQQGQPPGQKSRHNQLQGLGASHLNERNMSSGFNPSEQQPRQGNNSILNQGNPSHRGNSNVGSNMWNQNQQQSMMVPMMSNPMMAAGGMMVPQNMLAMGMMNPQQLMGGMVPVNMSNMLSLMQQMGSSPEAGSTKKPNKKRRKKPKDKPKRPLSAYNLFFKDEREKILDEIPSEEGKDEEQDPKSLITWPGKKRPPHGKISFDSLAKTIGSRWKSLSKERLVHYKEMATEDLSRYAKEMKLYEKKVNLREKEKEIKADDDLSAEKPVVKSGEDSRKRAVPSPEPFADVLNSCVGDIGRSNKKSKKRPAKGQSEPNSDAVKNLMNGSANMHNMGGFMVPMMFMNQANLMNNMNQGGSMQSGGLSQDVQQQHEQYSQLSEQQGEHRRRFHESTSTHLMNAYEERMGGSISDLAARNQDSQSRAHLDRLSLSHQNMNYGNSSFDTSPPVDHVHDHFKDIEPSILGINGVSSSEYDYMRNSHQVNFPPEYQNYSNQEGGESS